MIPIKTNVQIVCERLKAEGFTGLYVPGECSCHLDDLALCGYATEDADGYINDCQPGHLIRDPSGKTDDWLVSGSVKSMTQEEFDITMGAFR